MLRSFALTLAVMVMSCADSGGSSPAEPVRLRVVALHGLGSFAPSKSRSGASSYALSLTHLPCDQFARVVERSAEKIRLRMRDDSPYSAQELASIVSDEALEKAAAIDDSEVILHFRDAESAALYESLGLVKTGPYVLDTQAAAKGVVTLRAIDPGRAIQLIDIVELDPSEAWRRLLARDVDVIPNNPSAHRPMFDDVESVRVVDHQEGGWLGLLFNLNRFSASERRAIALAIDRAAVAQIGAGSESAAISLVQPTLDSDLAEPRSVDRELELVVLASDQPASDAARVVRLQLAAAGITVTVRALPLKQLLARAASGEFDLAIAPLQAGADFFANLAADDQRDIAKYDSPEFDRLVQNGNLAAAEDVLSEEVPVLPLFERKSFAAIDARFCGGNPRWMNRWRWLADLYPCEEGP